VQRESGDRGTRGDLQKEEEEREISNRGRRFAGNDHILSDLGKKWGGRKMKGHSMGHPRYRIARQQRTDMRGARRAEVETAELQATNSSQ